MPQDLYAHVQASTRWHDDLWVFGLYAPLFTLALAVIALLIVGTALVDGVLTAARWLRR